MGYFYKSNNTIRFICGGEIGNQFVNRGRSQESVWLQSYCVKLLLKKSLYMIKRTILKNAVLV